MDHFVKVTCGHACKLAVLLKATWTSEPNSLVRYAVNFYGEIVAHADCDGYFIATRYEHLSVKGIVA